MELAGETPGVQVSGSGAAILNEGGEDTVYTAHSEGWVKIRSMRRGCVEYGFHGHGLYTGDKVALRTVSKD